MTDRTTDPRTQAFVRFEDGPRACEVVELSGRKVRVGREAPSEVIVELSAVSGIHAVFEREKDDWYITDIGTDGNGSTNGTSINGTEIERVVRHPVENGDLIRLGPQPGGLLMTFWQRRPIDPLQLRLHADSRAIFLDHSRLDVQLSPQQYEFLEFVWNGNGTLRTYEEIGRLLWDYSTIEREEARGRAGTLAKEVNEKFETILNQHVVANIYGKGYRLNICGGA